MAVVDKIKSDINFRNKVIGGAVLFTLMMALGVFAVLVMDKEKDSQENRETEDRIAQEMAKSVVPTDTTLSVSKKRKIYEQMDFFQNEESKDIKVVSDESIIGKTSEEIAQKHREEEDEISSYMKQRRQKMNASVKKQENISEPSIENRQTIRHNSYDLQNNWQEDEIQSHKTGREKISEPKQEKQIQRQEVTRKSKAKRSSNFEDLPPVEQRRILLETGQSQYKETEEFTAMIMSSGMVKPGNTITLITKEDAYISFEKIPKGTTIAGIVSFSENRLQVSFSTIRLKKKILKVNLTLYGLDGLAGLPVGSDVFSKDVEDTGVDGVMEQDITGTTIERIGKTLFRGRRSKKEIEVDLGRDIMCILVNNNVEQ